MNEEIAALVQAARAGDRQAFAELYTRHSSLVRATLLAHAQPDDVPDLAQEVFLTALQRLHEIREPGAFPAWLAAVARNIARMHHRSTRSDVPLTHDLPGRFASPDDAIDAERALSAIRQLPEQMREPLLLRLVEGMSGQEIARSLGMTHAAVRVNLHRGVKLLRQALEKDHV